MTHFISVFIYCILIIYSFFKHFHVTATNDGVDFNHLIHCFIDHMLRI